MKLSNIALKKYRKFLKKEGLNQNLINKGRGGHEKWSRKDLDRPLILQSHEDPVPRFIVHQHLRYLNMSKDDFETKINPKSAKR